MRDTCYDSIVVGAGISGLSEAYHLSGNGQNVLLLEGSDRVGGMIQSIRQDGFLIETGATSLQLTPQLEQRIEQLGLKKRMVQANETARNRYLLRNQQLHALPLSPFALLGCRLITPAEKWRLLLEPFKSTGSGDMSGDMSVCDFFTHRIGKSLTQVLIDAFVSGIWAGDIGKLSMQSAFPQVYQGVGKHGSLFQYLRHKKNSGTSKKIVSFDEGLGVLTQGFLEALGEEKVLLKQQVKQITRLPSNDDQVRWQVETDTSSFRCKSLSLAVPANALHTLLEHLPDHAQNMLDSAPHAPIISISLGFDRAQIAHSLNGFGMLFPRNEGKETLGVIFSSTLFANRCSEGNVLLTAFIGGRHNPHVLTKPSKEVLQCVLDDIAPILKITGKPIFEHEHRWHLGIPQYEMGHQQRQNAFNAHMEKHYPQVHICGNFSEGVAVADRVNRHPVIAGQMGS